MDGKKEITLTVSEFIKRISKQLDIKQNEMLGNGDLISLIKHCPFLYDKSLADFKDIQKKNEAWEAIGKVFGMSAGDVQIRWKGLRDSFSKAKNRHLNEDSGLQQSSKQLVNCAYYEELKFLEPHICRRNRTIPTEVEIRNNNSGSTVEEIKLFIERIKNTPILYHQKFKSGVNQSEKIEAWKKIATSFGFPFKDCLMRWRNLRERYSKERRSGGNKKWEFYQDLSFLDPHIKRRKRLLRLEKPIPIQPKPSLCFVVESNSPQSRDETICLNRETFLTKKEIDFEDVEFFDVSNSLPSSEPMFSEENELSQSTSSQIIEPINKIADEDELFGRTIAAELKNLSCPRKKMKLKAEIYKLLYDNSCED